MSGVRSFTRVLSALLEPDGTIQLSLLFPDSDEPLAATIQPIETTARAAGPKARDIDLDGREEADRHLRLLIAMHADALAYEREVEQLEQIRRVLCAEHCA
jgi:hypothetical protein